jgi:hypothetical protein
MLAGSNVWCRSRNTCRLSGRNSSIITDGVCDYNARTPHHTDCATAYKVDGSGRPNPWFEKHALEREEELLQICQNAKLIPGGHDNETREDDGEKMPEDDSDRKIEAFIFVDEIKVDNQTVKKCLDRASVPATPDCLVKDGIGLQAFLRSGKEVGNRQPRHAIGERAAAPAIMSYGRAVSMFGQPTWEDPSDEPEDTSDEPGDSSDEPEDAPTEPQEQSISTQDRHEPDSEGAHRTHMRLAQSKPLLTETKQWELFMSNKYMGETAILANQYAKLFAENAQAKPDSEIAVDSTKQWPPVELLDFDGFTNWIHRCRKEVGELNFKKVILKRWKEERAARSKVVVPLLKNWTIPNGFDDGRDDHPYPSQYFPRGSSLGEIDLAKRGRKTKLVGSSAFEMADLGNALPKV